MCAHNNMIQLKWKSINFDETICFACRLSIVNNKYRKISFTLNGLTAYTCELMRPKRYIIISTLILLSSCFNYSLFIHKISCFKQLCILWKRLRENWQQNDFYFQAMRRLTENMNFVSKLSFTYPYCHFTHPHCIPMGRILYCVTQCFMYVCVCHHITSTSWIN